MATDVQRVIMEIHLQMRSECFSDLAETLPISKSTVYNWRKAPPVKPSLHVFCTLAWHYGYNLTLHDMVELL